MTTAIELPLEPALIDGNWSEGTEPPLTLIEPATGQAWRRVASVGLEEVEQAVRAANRAFYQGDWPQLSSRDRTHCLLKFAALIREQAEVLAELESRNVGKPIRQARDDVALAANCFEYYAGAINKVGGQTIPVAARGLSMTLREPIGVCGLITPWNFPIAIAAWKIAPALAMGNTIVLKPASQTPLTALRLGKLALDAGIPPGVLNVVPGAGSQIGDALVRHPQVRKISFTGSNPVGVRVAQLAAEGVKRVSLELGGKSANIVFADADLEKAVESAVDSAFGNAGQDCCARSRLLLERAVYDEFVERLGGRLRSLQLGSPLDEHTEMGPLISFSHRDRVQHFVDLGLQTGATLLQGGEPAAGELAQGAYFQPTLLGNVAPDDRLAQEEIFGPVVCAMPFDREADAIALANNSRYGLSGSLWTRDIGRALRVARAIQTGMLSINSGSSAHLEAPFGGVKQSGLGREMGLQVLDYYSEWKSIFIATE